jgi:hypothetical protein
VAFPSASAVEASSATSTAMTPAYIGPGETARPDGLRDPKPSPPQDDDQSARPGAVRASAGSAHDGDDPLDPGWIGRVAHSLVSGWAARVIAGQGRRRASATGCIHCAWCRHLILLELARSGPASYVGGFQRPEPSAGAMLHGKTTRNHFCFSRNATTGDAVVLEPNPPRVSPAASAGAHVGRRVAAPGRTTDLSDRLH